METKNNDSTKHFLQDAFKDVESMEKFALLIASGGNLQDHFYQIENGRPDYEKPNIGMIILVISWGEKLKIPFTTALQQIIPMDGKMTIKGDLAKALIFDRGDYEDWKEELTGTMEGSDLEYSITCTSEDITLTRSFSIIDARQKGLYPSDAKLKGAHKASWLQSPWVNYPDRMLMYRALGFIARDLFPDVMQGLILQEEVRDYPDMGKIVVELPDGSDLELKHRTGKEARSESITQHAVAEIDEKDNSDPLQQGEDVKPAPSKAAPAPVPNDGIPREVYPHAYRHTEEELKKMQAGPLQGIVNVMGLTERIKAAPGQNTNKKIRTIILEYYAESDRLGGEEPTPKGQGADPETAEVPTPEPAKEPETPAGETPPPEEPIEPNADFENQGAATEEPPPEEKDIPVVGLPEGVETANAWKFECSDLMEDGERQFNKLSELFKAMTAHKIGDDNYAKVAERIPLDPESETGETMLSKFPDKESFCLRASIVEINTFINTFDGLS
jgi:hypothetical protein